MRRWLDPEWYGFLWQRKDHRGLAVVLVALVAALAAGGYAAAGSLESGGNAVSVVKLEAVKHTVRVKGRERVVTRYVTLATTDVAPPSTVVRTRVVTHPVVKTVQAAAVVRRHLVYVTRKGLTVTRSRTLTQQQTQTATETTVQTVTQPSTVVDSKTVTRRVTTTAPAQTVTVTGAVITVTLPAKTVTRTTTVTVTTKPPPPPPPTTTTKP